jgi:hypothetical protein
MNYEAKFWWDCFCVLSGFSLGWKCTMVADKSFLKLIESLSLSLGFPTLGFSLTFA